MDSDDIAALDDAMSDEPRASGYDAFKFALDSPKGSIRQTGSGGDPEPVSAPRQLIDETRAAVRDNPTLGEGLETLTDYVVGTGFSVQPRNVPGVDGAELTIQDIGETKQIVETSDFDEVLWDAVWHAFQDGVSFIEINWRDEIVFEPMVLPAKDMEIQYDEFGRIQGYILDSGGGEPVEYGKYDVAHLGFWKHPAEDWFHPLVDRVLDQSDMLADMEIDMARFVATKAYPPILWKLGDETEWSPSEIDSWMDDISNIQPDSMLVGPGDVETETVGVTSTSNSRGAMDLTPTFQHLERRQATGLGLPFALINGVETGPDDIKAVMPKYDRRIKRLRTVVRNMVEHQILRSLYYHPNPEESEGELVPKFEFGNHSSEEDRLEVKTALKLFNHGFLTRQAFAQRVGIDPETEMPSLEELQSEILPVLQALQGTEAGGGRPSEDDSQERTAQISEDTGDDARDQRSVEDSDGGSDV